MRRRAVLLGAGALGGCGFRPLYLPEGGASGPAATGLAAIYVPVQGERSGQLLRQALQRRMDGAGSGVAKLYELVASAQISQEGVAVQRDTSITRIRISATGGWTLRRLNLEHTVLTSGSSRALDGFNIINQQYFAADLENEAATRRVTEALADQIVQQVAIYLRRQAAG